MDLTKLLCLIGTTGAGILLGIIGFCGSVLFFYRFGWYSLVFIVPAGMVYIGFVGGALNFVWDS
jgi:hypothetical protein